MFPTDFQLKFRDGLSRIGQFETYHGTVETPALMPVIDPINLNIVSIPKLESLGMKILITNAYLLYKNESKRKIVIEEGIHKYLNYNGPIMTDSGAFQLMEYGKVDISNREITKFQEDIDVDIGVFLDLPVSKGTEEQLTEAVNKTIQRAQEHILIRNSSKHTQWVGPIQGGNFFPAYNECLQFMKDQPFAIHAIGSVVPLMENYDYSSVAKMILQAKKILPSNRPLHLFGAGHPMLFGLACYLGIDLFDSAAYVLFARNGRYMTSQGTYQLSNMDYFPCICKFCSETTPKEVKSLSADKKTKFLSNHNLAISFSELNHVKQAITEGRLFNYVLSRSTAHPQLSKAVKLLIDDSFSTFSEQFLAKSYSKARFYTHPWSIYDPFIHRHFQYLKTRYLILRNNLIIKQPGFDIPPDISAQIMNLDPVFGIVPEEWRNIYPLLQNESYLSVPNEKTKLMISNLLKEYENKFKNVIILSKDIYSDNTYVSNFDSIAKGNRLSEKELIISQLAYQYGIKNFKTFPEIETEFSRKTKRLKSFSTIDNQALGVFRAHDNLIIPQTLLIKWLHKNLSYPRGRVVIDSEVESFIKLGKSVFCKFVQSIDFDLRIGDEVLIVNEHDILLGAGTLNYAPIELLQFKKGIAVKTRKRNDL